MCIFLHGGADEYGSLKVYILHFVVCIHHDLLKYLLVDEHLDCYPPFCYCKKPRTVLQ